MIPAVHAPPALPPPNHSAWRWSVAVFVVVTTVQLWLIAWAGTDVPFDDQWDAEGSELYPKWMDGTLRFSDLTSAHNEHRIFWTRIVDLALFILNGQWDPLLQLIVNALLRGAVPAVIMWLFMSTQRTQKENAVMAVVLTLAFLPHLAWNNTLWAFQSQISLTLLFSIAALRLLGSAHFTAKRLWSGFGCGVAAQFAMSSGAFVAVALFMIVGLRIAERRTGTRRDALAAVVALGLIALAMFLRVDVPGHRFLRASSWLGFSQVVLGLLSWPHAAGLALALIVNAPLLIVLVLRIRGPRCLERADFGLLLGAWAVVNIAASAYFRGGGGGMFQGIPSRYIDNVVLLAIGNAWCVIELVGWSASRRRQPVKWTAAIWGAFLFVGWLGASAETMRDVILPRIRNPDASLPITRALQITGDAKAYYDSKDAVLPHPSAETVCRVLADPRLQGALPPSLQPDHPLGPLSRAARGLLSRD